MSEPDPRCEAIAEAIREASRQERLVGREELRAALAARELEVPAPGDETAALVAATLAAHGDLAALTSVSGEELYHAPDLLSRTYAAILDRKGSPLVLIAEEVRRHSADYPRPLPVDLFERPPFDLAPEEIEACLLAMASDAAFADVTFTTASTGAVYLFSSRHLDRRYARFLAERAEVGLVDAG